MEVVAFSPPAEVDFDAVTEPFWMALREGRLTLQRCAHGHDFRMPPMLYCPECHSTDAEWVALSGRMRLYTYTIVSLRPRDAESPVYVAALACPEEAPDTKIFGNVIECAVEELAIGMPMEIVQASAGTDAALFRPVRGDR